MTNKELTTLKTDLFQEMKQVTNFFDGNEDEAKRFMTAMVEHTKRIPKLLEADRQSLVLAAVQMAQFRFLPSGVMGEAYIIPYNNSRAGTIEAKFQLGYQGIVTLLYRTNKIKTIQANIVYANDDFEYEEGMESRLIHRPTKFGQPKGEAVGVYTIVEMVGGGKTFKAMGKDEIMKIKALSKAADKPDSPWNSKNDPELWMWKKTCLIQHAKLLPKTPDLQKAIEIDYEAEARANAIEVLSTEQQSEIDALTLETIGPYYQAHKGKGKAFDKAIMERKRELETNNTSDGN